MSNRDYYHPRDGAQPTYEFTTDGCSGGMSWFWQTFIKPFTKTDIPWRGCCVEHDKEYWMGGTWKERQIADQVLRECVAAKGYPIGGFLM